jgi:tetratricopeptide (TPR) repeat protein
LAGGVAAIALPLTLLLGRYQVATLAADAAFRRAQVAEPAADFVVAIRATQDAIALVPRQSEYYSLLGQYYGALAPRATGSELPDFVAAPATATSLRQPTQLSRDQVFDLGRVSLETAIQLNPLDVRFHTTLGQLYRYWDETAGTTAHLAAAQAQFEAATRLKPNDVEGHVGAADVRLQAGDYADALVRAEHARTLMPTYWYPYEVMARAHMALHQYPEAYAAADDAIQRGSRWGLGFKAPTQADVSRLTALRREAAELGGGPPGA